MDLWKYRFQNPQGLNEILSELLDKPITGDWKEFVSTKKYVGKKEKEKAKVWLEGKISHSWGRELEKGACSYLDEKLKSAGWDVKHGFKIGDNEYDCVGWKNKSNQESPDLAVEMYFPMPHEENSYKLNDAKEKIISDSKKLDKLNSAHKYILVGISKDTITIDTSRRIEKLFPNIKLKFQTHKFGKIAIEKTKKFVRRHCYCPYCKEKTVVVLWERDGRIPYDTYVFHKECPFCKRKIEALIREYEGRNKNFQRILYIRMPRAKKHVGSEKGPKRNLEILKSYPP